MVLAHPGSLMNEYCDPGVNITKFGIRLCNMYLSSGDSDSSDDSEARQCSEDIVVMYDFEHDECYTESLRDDLDIGEITLDNTQVTKILREEYKNRNNPRNFWFGGIDIHHIFWEGGMMWGS